MLAPILRDFLTTHQRPTINRPCRLLSVVHYPVFGGQHNRVSQLAGPLRELGWETTLVLPSDAEADAAVERVAARVRVVRRSLHRLRASVDPLAQARYLSALAPEVGHLARLIRRGGFDLVQVNDLFNPQAAIAARLVGVPVVWQIIDQTGPLWARRLLMRVVERAAGAVLFTGSALRDVHLPGDSHVPSFVYYPPVDTQRFIPSLERRRALRATLGIPADAFVVGTLANLNPQKGLEDFVGAAARIHAAVPDTWFVVAGARYPTHGAYADRVVEAARQTGIPADRFLFPGEAREPEAFYPALDLFLLSSRSEGAPTTVIEAMACGLPVVTTDVGAVRELVVEGITGLVVPAGDAAAMADAVLELARDPDRRARMAAKARARAVTEFDLQACAAVHAEAFRAALRGP